MTRNFLTTFTMLVFVAAAFGQQAPAPAFPDTKEGKRGSAFMKLLGTDDAATLKSFVENEMALEKGMTVAEKVTSTERLRSFLSNSKLRKVLAVTPQALTFLIETSRGSIARVTVNLDPANEGRIKDVGAERVSEEALNEPSDEPKLTEAEVLEAVKKYLKELETTDRFSGSVLIAKGGKPILSGAYGLADRDKKVANNTETKFNLGSINKAFTMLAIGMLADEGKLTLTDTIGKHLPDYPNKAARDKVNITHLLTMASGIGDIFGDEYEATPKGKLRTIDAYLPLFASKPLEFEPGTSRQYSNGGFLVLGAIIEKVSGQTYYDFVRERIFKPIGMTDTESYESDAKTPNRATGYSYSETEKKRVKNIATLPGRGSSAGGGYSTLADMLKFANALESGSFKTPASLKTVNDPMIKGIASGELGIGGGAPGINAVVDNRIGNGYTVIVLANYDPPAASNVSQRIRRWFGD